MYRLLAMAGVAMPNEEIASMRYADRDEYFPSNEVFKTPPDP
jgi:hypothetical protein